MSKHEFYDHLFERTRTQSLLAVGFSQEEQAIEPSSWEKIYNHLKPFLTWSTTPSKKGDQAKREMKTNASGLLVKLNELGTRLTGYFVLRSSEVNELDQVHSQSLASSRLTSSTSHRSNGGFGLILKWSNSLPPLLLILTGAISIGTTGFFVLRDQMIMSLLQKQSDLELIYENRLISLRAEIDKITSRQMVDQDSLEGRMQAILLRQAQLENRASMIAALSDQVGSIRPAVNLNSERSSPKSNNEKISNSPGIQKNSSDSLSLQNGADGGSNSSSLKNPLVSDKAPASPGLKNKPQPEGLELGRPGSDKLELGPKASLNFKTPQQIALDQTQPLDVQLEQLSLAIDDFEHKQISSIARARELYSSQASRLKVAFTEIGLSPESLVASRKGERGMGGPFIPMKLNPKAEGFDGEIARLQAALMATETMQKALPFVPLRKPLPVIDQTSSFGYRVDPFIGRMAMHTGIDLRLSRGAPVHATAAGKVDSAGYNGGYGNMVDIDHGNGLVTRYGHLASITVKEGQSVKIGDVIGLLGSTGRSTGPHLHYEIRIHDAPVDPLRFLRAGAKLVNDL